MGRKKGRGGGGGGGGGGGRGRGGGGRDGAAEADDAVATSEKARGTVRDDGDDGDDDAARADLAPADADAGAAAAAASPSGGEGAANPAEDGDARGGGDGDSDAASAPSPAAPSEAIAPSSSSPSGPTVDVAEISLEDVDDAAATPPRPRSASDGDAGRADAAASRSSGAPVTKSPSAGAGGGGGRPGIFRRLQSVAGTAVSAFGDGAATLRRSKSASAKDARGGGGGGAAGGDGERGAAANHPAGAGAGGMSSDEDEAERAAVKTAKKRARKARRRLKRLVHATNAMGAAVSAKEQTTTQLALCMQLGLALGLRHQRPAHAIKDADLPGGDPYDAANDKEGDANKDPPLTLEVGSKAVGDGTRLPAFRFILHAPSRFERVRAAWGLQLPDYVESFQLDGGRAVVDAIAAHELLGRGLAEDTAEEDFAAAKMEEEKRRTAAGTGAGAGGGGAGAGAGPASPSSSDDRWVKDKDKAQAAAARDHQTTKQQQQQRQHRRQRTLSLASDDFDYASDDFENGPDHASADETERARRHVSSNRLLPSTTSLRVISTNDASGKSSSWFFCSKDSRFLVKTCTPAEMNVLLKILPRYTKHASEHRASSLLPQYYGLYTIEVGRRSKAHFIIMNYWFATMHEIGTRYDLKGSTKGRRASAKEKKKGPSAIYKDLDFLARNQCVETPLAEDVKVAIAKDVEFMRANKLIDYSMMLGLHTRRREGEEAVAEGDSPGRGPGYGLKPGPGPRASVSDDDAAATTAPGAPPSSPEGGDAPDDQSSTPPGPNTAARLETYRRRVDGKVGPFSASVEEDETAMFQLRALETPDGLAYLGIIDILTQYGGAKAIENFCCGVVAGCGADISCQPPRKYARRFLRLINKMLKPPEKDGAEWEERGDGAVRKLEWR